MPIRLDAALASPPLENTRLNMPQMSEEAAAPGRALGELARRVSAIAEPFAQHAENVQRFEDQRKTTEKQTAFEEGYARQVQEAASIADPAERLKANQQWLADNRPDTSDLSPVAREGVENWYVQTASHYGTRAGADAMRQSWSGAAQGSMKRYQAKVAAGDFDGGKAVLREALQSGVMNDREAANLEKQTDELAANHAAEQRITRDFRGYLADHRDGKFPTDANPVVQQDRLARANQLRREDTATTAEAIHRGMDSGLITTPEQVDRIAGNLDEDARGALKAELAKRGDPQARARMASPEWHDEAAGRLGRMLADHPAGQDISDTDFLKADSLLRSIPEGPLKTDYRKRIGLLRDGKADTRVDPIRTGWQAIDAAATAGFLHVPGDTGRPDQNYGEVSRKFAAWAEKHADADEDAVLRKTYELVSPYRSAVRRGSAFAPPPNPA